MTKIQGTISLNENLERSRKTPFSVIPAEAGIQEKAAALAPGFRRGDGLDDFLLSRHFSLGPCTLHLEPCTLISRNLRTSSSPR